MLVGLAAAVRGEALPISRYDVRRLYKLPKVLPMMFENALYKLQRSLDLQGELLSRIGSYIDSGAVTLEARTEPQLEGDDMQFMAVVIKERLPAYISLVIGDAIHCLRASLDYLTSELLRSKGKNGRTTFPMHETESNLNDLMYTGVLGRAVPELIPIILDQVKPYARKEVCIWHIGHFDNIDKHNLIIPTLSTSRVVGASFHTRHSVCIHATLAIGEQNRVDGFQSQSPQPFIITDPGKPQVALRFPEGKALAGEDVIISLRKMNELVMETINIFGRKFCDGWKDYYIGYDG